MLNVRSPRAPRIVLTHNKYSVTGHLLLDSQVSPQNEGLLLKTQTGIDGWDQWGMVTLLEENLNCYVLHIYIKCFCGWWTDSPLCAGQHHGTPAVSSVPSHPHTISLNLWMQNDKLCSQTVYHRDNPVIIEQYVMERRIGKEERDKEPHYSYRITYLLMQKKRGRRRNCEIMS